MIEGGKDHIGFDPIAWVERLQEVNRTSQFPEKDKALIAVCLRQLKLNLEGNRHG